MPNHLSRFLLTGLLCLAFAGLTACGGEEGTDEGANYECVEDGDCAAGEACTRTGRCIAADICTEDGDCDDDQICLEESCVEGCRYTSDCEGTDVCVENSCEARKCSTDEDCGDARHCDRGLCKDDPVQCEGVTASAVEACDPDGEIADGYDCMNFGSGNMCYLQCDQASGDNLCLDDEYDICPAGSFCAQVTQAGDSVCFASQCGHPGDTESCQDLVDAEPDEFENGVNCVPYHSDSRTFGCVPAGVLEEGEACGEFIDEECGEGLSCGIQGVCKPVCDEDSDCTGDDRCIADDTGAFFVGVGYGVCGSGCDARSTGQCDRGEGCVDVTPEDGACQPTTAEVPAYGACDGPIACDSDSDCPGQAECSEQTDTCNLDGPNQCEDGTQCITLQSGEVGEHANGRCLPTCDNTLGSQAARDATCPGGDAASFGRFVHLVPGGADVEVRIDDTLVDTLSSDVGRPDELERDFVDFPLGHFTLEADDTTTTSDDGLAVLDVRQSLNEQSTFALVQVPGQSGAAELDVAEYEVPRDVELPAIGHQRMRMALGANFGQPVDLYVVDSDLDDLTGETPTATGLEYGQATAFSADMEPGDYTVHIFVGGADAESAEPMHSFDMTLKGSPVQTWHIWGLPDDNGDYSSVSASVLAYAEAAVTSTQGYCYDTDDSMGLCFQKCSGPDGYGDGECASEEDTCFPFGESEHICWPSEKLSEGSVCDPSASNPCEEGAYCLAQGDGNGICTSYCQPGGSQNDALQCGSDQACEPIGDPSLEFGRCGYPCEPREFPNDVSSSDCPTGLETCLAYESDENNEPTQAFCRASGPVNVGGSCGDVRDNNCAPGGTCRRAPDFPMCTRAPRRGTLTATLYDPAGLIDGTDGGVCREVCELFTDSCSSPDEACMIDGTTMSTTVGFCMPKADELDELESMDPCPYELNGMMCGDGSVCTTLSGSSMCMQWCDRKTDAGCAEGEECSRLFDADTVELGYCTEPR
ncbi:MAG: hypothetical protein ACLFVJ_05075 [Persicimonas sp.]